MTDMCIPFQEFKISYVTYERSLCTEVCVVQRNIIFPA